jgi:diadenosine tetraphosphate (Ap4A) HIT family hydrolase
MSDCPFCPPQVQDQVVMSDAWCYAIWTDDTGTPAGSAMVLPIAHRPTVFDLTGEEWTSTMTLLRAMKQMITTQHAPEGWNVGWNVHPVGGQSIPHAHCHLVPRYTGEPFAGRGIRSWIKDPINQPPKSPG